ncbi:hypothetical protein [Candidatus Nitrososphaera sp. FF02]|uniref:hypothetical protein n=1 Tax=Candidatus Nitrososphaera sp. FF02 TaxID=3398226 RepID=UPI0039EA401B
MAGPYFEILTMGGFRMAVARTDGFIVIVDSASGKKVHKAGCSWVTKKNFEEKVVENEREHGRYLLVRRPAHRKEQVQRDRMQKVHVTIARAL